jgi:hypothetical protein
MKLKQPVHPRESGDKIASAISQSAGLNIEDHHVDCLHMHGFLEVNVGASCEPGYLSKLSSPGQQEPQL